MKKLIMFILIFFSVTYAQLQKQLTFIEMDDLKFENFILLIFMDENNSRWYVFSADVNVDSTYFKNYKFLKPQEKYSLELYNVENYNMPIANIPPRTGYCLYDKLSIDNFNPIEKFYFTPSLVGHYYIECN
jgi:hypothetical protein